MEYLVKKDLGVDETTGLNQRIVITQLTIDGVSEKVSVSYSLETLSPTGVIVTKTNPRIYTRYNASAVVDGEGNVIKEANLKFNQLKDSQLGQTIIGMLQLTINDYPFLDQV